MSFSKLSQNLGFSAQLHSSSYAYLHSGIPSHFVAYASAEKYQSLHVGSRNGVLLKLFTAELNEFLACVHVRVNDLSGAYS